MKNKSLLLLPSLIFIILLTSNVFSQHVQPVDHGISVLNYKHMNKAKQARKKGQNGLFILENSFRSASKHGMFRKNVNQDYTPKYTSRENAFVIYIKEKKSKMEINPLASSRNYKTGNFKSVKSMQKDSLVASIKSLETLFKAQGAVIFL